MTDEERKVWEEELSHFVKPQADPLCLYALCLAADAELTRLRAIAANERNLLECLKREEERAEKAEAALCRAREWLVTAKTLNGTECSYHDPHRKKYAIKERCGKCILCLIDYAITVHLSSAPCPHEAEAKRLKARLTLEMNVSKEVPFLLSVIASGETLSDEEMYYQREQLRRAGGNT